MKFLSRSLLVLLFLYGLVFVVGNVLLSRADAPLWWAMVFAVAFVGLQFLIGPWLIEWLLDISWDDDRSRLPARNREFVERLCRERGLEVPRIGVIESGAPNAFAFGHVPGNARVVVTTGLLDVLTPEEANAVLAHEIGHVEHWDFMVMTVAALAPLLLYQIYVWTNSYTRTVAYTAYLCYLVSQFIVLSLNRTREYFADHYSAKVTGAPDALASALVKIAYGMVRADGEATQALQSENEKTRAAARRAQRISGTVAVMGISNLRSGSALWPAPTLRPRRRSCAGTW